MAYIAHVKNGVIESSVSTEKADATKVNENIGKSKLGYDQFLQLLCAEMQYQDPLEPTSNTDYVAQMATFSQLEATLSMKDSLSDSSDSTIKSMANALVGKEVVVVDDESETGFADGIVDYVMYQNGEPYLSVNDQLYPASSLDTVADSEYYEGVTLAETVTNMVMQLPDMENLNAAWEKAVTQIRELYDGMTSYQQQFVSDDTLVTLKEYEDKMKELLLQEEQSKEPEVEGSDESSDDNTEGDTTVA